MSFVEIARFDSRLEAEAIGHALDQHEIPFLIQGGDVGIFGPGMVGRSPVEVSLHIPEAALERVRELLTCVVSDPGVQVLELGEVDYEAHPELRGDQLKPE